MNSLRVPPPPLVGNAFFYMSCQTRRLIAMVYHGLQNTALAVTITFPALATIVVAMRVYSRIVWSHFGWGKVAPKKKKKNSVLTFEFILITHTLDDGFIVAAMVRNLKSYWPIFFFLCIKFLTLTMTMTLDPRHCTCLPLVDVYDKHSILSPKSSTH
jgi:hypothetical protein